MKITILGSGTSQGVPVIGCRCEVCRSADPRDKRLRSSIFVQTQGKNLVVDTGPDFRQQMLRLDADRLDAVLLTHNHKDHVAGLDDIRAFNNLQQNDMPVYAEPYVQKALRNEFPYIFADHKYPGVPNVALHTIGEEPFEVQGVPILPIRVLHYRLPVLGFRFGDFAYVTDASSIPPEHLERLRGCKVLVINALRHEKHISHFTVAEALEVIDQVKPEVAYLTHISHKLGHTQTEAALPPNVRMAYDGLEIEL